MIVVDTNVWSELTRAEPDKRVIDWEAANMHLLWMPTVVLAEFRARALLLPAGRNRDATAETIERVVTAYSDRLLSFDEPASRLYGVVLAEARNRGKPISAADAMIAATARSHGMRVATRDRNDFAGAGVDIIDPWSV